MVNEAKLSPLSPTPRSTLRRHRDRAQLDRDALYALLDQAAIAYVGVPGPMVLPMAFARVEDTLYLHGAIGNGLLRGGSEGAAQVCVTVTHLDGLVLARSAFHHSMNYRSAVVFGPLRSVESEEEKRVAFDALVNHALPGRSEECRPSSDAELRATRVVALSLAEASVKVRAGGPKDADEDLGLPHWAGVLPLFETAGVAIADAEQVPPDPTLPPSLVRAALRRAPQLPAPAPASGAAGAEPRATSRPLPEGVILSHDPTRLELGRLFHWLRDDAYWATDLTPNTLVQAIASSYVVGAYAPQGELIGFARVVTDGATLAWLADVFVDASWRARGIGLALSEALVLHPSLRGVRRFMLGTRDAHGLYAKLGFEPVPDGIYMVRRPGLTPATSDLA